MRSLKLALAWTIGFFAVLYPIHFAFNGTIQQGLLNGILGLAGILIILKFGDRI